MSEMFPGSHLRWHGARGQHAHLSHHRSYRRGDPIHHVDHAVAGPDGLDDIRVVHHRPAVRMADLHRHPVHHGERPAVGQLVRRDHAVDQVAPDKFSAHLFIFQFFHYFVFRVRAHRFQGGVRCDEERVLVAGGCHGFEAGGFHK